MSVIYKSGRRDQLLNSDSQKSSFKSRGNSMNFQFRLFIPTPCDRPTVTSLIRMKGKTTPTTNFVLYLKFYDQPILLSTMFSFRISSKWGVVRDAVHKVISPFGHRYFQLLLPSLNICMFKIFKELFDGETQRYKYHFPEKSQNPNPGGHL